GVAVGAGGAVGDDLVLAARDRIAAVGGAGVVVVAVERSAGGADARLAGLGAVAHGRIGAGSAVDVRGVGTARGRVARVGRAGIGVVADQCGSGGADARLHDVRPIAGVAVGAGGAVADRGVLAARDRIAGVGGAGVVVVAIEGGAGGADA